MKITLGNLKYLILPSEKVMVHDRNANVLYSDFMGELPKDFENKIVHTIFSHTVGNNNSITCIVVN